MRWRFNPNKEGTHMADQRVASTEERQEIAQFLGVYWGMNEPEEVEDISESANILVLDKYMSDGPGYMGAIYFVVFGGGPEFHLVLIRVEGQLEHIGSEFPLALLKPAVELQDPVMKHIMNDEQLLHDPGCTGPPCDCLPDKHCSKCKRPILQPELATDEDEICELCAGSSADHHKDEDCAGHLGDGCCVVCGAGHGDPCQECSGTGYHREGCTLSDAYERMVNT